MKPSPQKSTSGRSVPREFIKPRDKRDELKTYRELELTRDLKSQRQRRRVEARGKLRVIGDGSTAQPYLAVDGKRYRQVRLEHQRRLLVEARGMKLGLPADRLLAQLTPRIEGLTYAQLAEEAHHETAQKNPLPALGRALTEQEQARFADSRALEKFPPAREGGKDSAGAALQHVLSRIEQRQTHNPARYQTIWAQLVGADASAQSHLERVDAATQTAYFRCHNSVLSMDLQRRPGLAQKLSKALGLPVRQLRAKF
jgi:hypothetical protein